MKETLKLGFILLSITLVCGAILGFSNKITSVKIEEANRLANEEARIEILEDANQFELLEDEDLREIQSSASEIVEIFKGFKGDKLVGYTIKTSVRGYDGEIEFMTGLSMDGEITGIKILNHSETPGLGANISEDYFTDSFKGKPVDQELTPVREPNQDNEVQALTSATITTDAIVNGVNIVREAYNLNLSN